MASLVNSILWYVRYAIKTSNYNLHWLYVWVVVQNNQPIKNKAKQNFIPSLQGRL